MDFDKTVTFIDPESERSNCLLAIPKKGRIYEKCLEIILGAGLEHHRPNRLDVAHCTNINVTIVFLPAADIASYVGEGNVDVGITGLDCVEECDADVEKILVNHFNYFFMLLMLTNSKMS
jgi:ATP phosphoribosyltransferase